jgi:hypothetical protein
MDFGITVAKHAFFSIPKNAAISLEDEDGSG